MTEVVDQEGNDIKNVKKISTVIN